MFHLSDDGNQNFEEYYTKYEQKESKRKKVEKEKQICPYYDNDLSDDGNQRFEDFYTKYEQEESRRKKAEIERKKPCQIPNSSVSKPKKLGSNEKRPAIV